MKASKEEPQGGWGTDIVSITVGHHPYRKSLCLFVEKPNVIDVVAYFRDDDSARLFLEALAVIAKGLAR